MRVFLSAVSSEFGQARRELRHDFGTRRIDVATQEELSHLTGARTLLELLDNHIRDCAAMVCVIGRRSGAGFPTPTELAPYAALLPPDMKRASYTQFEFLLARMHGKDLIVCRPRPGHTPDVPDADLEAPDDVALQAAFVAHVEASGAPRMTFADTHELCRIVMRQPWVPLSPVPRADKPIVLPYPSLGELFKGRDAFMARLRDSLTRAGGGTAAIAGRAVHGMGGVGKTRLAVEYAWAHQDAYTALALLEAETPERLHSALAALVGPLRLGVTATEEEARVEAALSWLNANPGWFLILDNIDTAPALAAAHRLLGRLRSGHVVLTSRLHDFPRGVERLELDVLTLEDAAGFLLAATDGGRRKAADDDAQTRGLAEDLGQLALALEMAATTIERRGLGFAAYRAIWQGNRERVHGWAKPEITGYHHAVAETWRTSVDQVSEPARHLLERLAFLAPEPVPETLLEVAVPGAEAKDAMAALDDLAAYSLVTRDVESGTFLVHRSVQDVTRRELEATGTAAQRLAAALGWIDTAFTGAAYDVRSWPRLDPLALHAEAVARHADASAIADPTARLMNRLGTLSYAKAIHARAEPLMRRALAIDEANYGTDHPEVAIDLNNLATLLQATNRLGEAEKLMRRALAIDEASLGTEHPNVARDLNNLAQLLQATNRLGEAEKLMRRALAITEASLGTEHPNVAIRLNNLAGLLQDTNRRSEAEPLMRRALAIDEASLGTDHPDVARDLNNLAQLLQDTNRLGEAEPLMRRVIAIFEASLGKEHPDVAAALNNLAALLQDTNRLDEAEPLMRRALAICLALEHAIGREHPSRVTVQANYERLLTAMDTRPAEIAAITATLRRDAGLGDT